MEMPYAFKVIKITTAQYTELLKLVGGQEIYWDEIGGNYAVLRGYRCTDRVLVGKDLDVLNCEEDGTDFGLWIDKMEGREEIMNPVPRIGGERKAGKRGRGRPRKQ
jgi:hypothetical protein